MNALRLYRRYIGASLRAQMQYPGDFLVASAGAFFTTVIDFFAVYALFARFEQLEGWGFGEVALFYGVIGVAFALADMITRGFDVFGQMFVKTGDFDRLLVRRVRPFSNSSATSSARIASDDWRRACWRGALACSCRTSRGASASGRCCRLR